MASDSPIEVDDGSYGTLLGEYLEAAAEIGRLLDDFGRPRSEEVVRYERLRQRKRELRERLADVEGERTRAEVESVLDRALSSE